MNPKQSILHVKKDIRTSWAKRNVLSTMVVTAVVDSQTSKPVFATKPFDVYDFVSG